MRLAGTPVPRRGLTVSHFADTPVMGLRHLVTGETAHLDGGMSPAINTHPLLAQKAAASVFTGADLLERGVDDAAVSWAAWRGLPSVS